MDPDEVEEAHDHDEPDPRVTRHIVIGLHQEVAMIGRMQNKQVWKRKEREGGNESYYHNSKI